MSVRRISQAGLFCLCLLLLWYVVKTVLDNRYRRWVFAADAAITDAPVLCANGTLLTGSRRPLFALDAITGRVKWTYTFPTGHEYQTFGPVAGVDNSVYLVSEETNKPDRLYALDGDAGKPRWVVSAPFAQMVTTAGRRVFVGGRQMLALDSRTGKQQWAFQPAPAPRVSDEYGSDGHVETALCANGMVFVAFGCPCKRLFALDQATGKAEWSVALEDKAQFVCSVPSALAVTANNLVIVGEMGGLRALDGRTGKMQWKMDTDWNALSLHSVCSRGIIYVTSYNGSVYALSEATGNIKWKRTLSEEIASPPVLGTESVLYTGTSSNGIYALDAQTGETEWHLSFGWLTQSFPYGDCVSVTAGPEGTVYAASSDGSLYALKRP